MGKFNFEELLKKIEEIFKGKTGRPLKSLEKIRAFQKNKSKNIIFL